METYGNKLEKYSVSRIALTFHCTVRINWSSDQGKLCIFEAEGRDFTKKFGIKLFEHIYSTHFEEQYCFHHNVWYPRYIDCSS